MRTMMPPADLEPAVAASRRTGIRIGIRRRHLVLALALAHVSIAADVRAAACPDVAGHFRIAGSGKALEDALDVLGIRGVGFPGSEVRVSGSADIELSLWVRSGRTGAIPAQPARRLKPGVDYVCRDDWITFTGKSDSSRQIDDQWYEGRATLRIAPDTRGLNFVVAFSGSERITVYSYDSARISLPKPGTRKNVTEAIRWPDAAEPEPGVRAREDVREPPEVARVRRLVGDPKVLGNVLLNGLQAVNGGVLVQLRARKSDEVVRFEDRLRAAAIPYEFKRPPIWSDNAYVLQLLVRPGDGTGSPSRPSAHRVQQEILRMQHPLVDVTKVVDAGDAYVATLNILGQETLPNILARLRANTRMFGEIDVLGETVSPATPGLRVAQLSLRLR